MSFIMGGKPKIPKIEAPKVLADNTESDAFLARRAILRRVGAQNSTSLSSGILSGSSNNSLLG